MSNETPQVVDKRRFNRIDEIGAEKLSPNHPIYQALAEDGETTPGTFSPSSQPSTSPGMDFPTALKQVIKGNRVTRLEWEHPEIWLMMFYWGAINPKVQAGKYLSIHHADGTVHPLYVGDGDLLADDWVVVV